MKGIGLFRILFTNDTDFLNVSSFSAALCNFMIVIFIETTVSLTKDLILMYYGFTLVTVTIIYGICCCNCQIGSIFFQIHLHSTSQFAFV